VKADEIWSFCYAKERNVAEAKAAPADAGDIWTWTAMDRDSKLMISYAVGDRSAATAREFMFDLADRLATCVQLTTMAQVGTSHVERQTLTMRMGMRRFTRLTNAFSKKAENHAYAVALHFMHYNFCRTHKTLRMTPAMAAGLVSSPWEVEDLVALVEAADEPAKKRGPYKKRSE
jgi:IS1 family transposase